MTQDTSVGEELLKQNGLDPDTMPAAARKNLQEMVSAEERRLLRSKRFTKGLWVAVLALVLIPLGLSFILTPSKHGPSVLLVLPMLAYPLGIYALFCTVRLWLASRFLDMRRIQAQLAEITDVLKKQTKS